jgi:hypothetical protein
MSKRDLETGDLVKILSSGWAGSVGIVSKPITEQAKGHVLVFKDGFIQGMDATLEDIELVDESSEGFAQLGYLLIKLGSHVIEQKLIAYNS